MNLVVGCVVGWGQERGTEVDASEVEESALSASELLQAGHDAFARQNYRESERHWQQLRDDYGENELVQAELEKIKPLLAISKVAAEEFDVALELIDESLGGKLKLSDALREQLVFWRGVCLLKANRQLEAQRVFGEFYANEAHGHERRMEAMVLFGMAYLMQNEFVDASEFFEARLKQLESEKNAETRGRIAVLQLHALMESKENRRALRHLQDWFPRMQEITQLAAFQSLALALGAGFLEDRDYYSAIQALQRIWPRERLLQHQRAKLLDLEERHTALKFRKASQDAIYRIEGMIARVKREIENFEAIRNFDSALRLRLAMAYQEMGRYREAGLILEEMLERMENDPVVEQASVRLVQNWMEAQRWQKAVAASETYVKRFGDKESDSLRLVLFLKAEALKNGRRYDEAIAAFDVLLRRYPQSDLGPKCLFMKGVCHLNADRNLRALGVFEAVIARFPHHRLAEDAGYWKGMAYSFEKEHQLAREYLKEYLNQYKKGRYEGDAVFRRAFSLFALAAYPQAIEELREFAARFPDSPYVDESRLILGDALGARGSIDEAIASYSLVNKEASKFYEDAQFKIGKALRLTERHAELRAHFERYIERNAGSTRLVEAVYWIGWSHMAQENRDKAREVYLDTIARHGNDAAIVAIEDVLLALFQLYPGEERDLLHRELMSISSEASSRGDHTLALRVAWAEAGMYRNSDPRLAELKFLKAANLLDVKVHSSRMLADCADACYGAGRFGRAEELYVGLRKWNPRALEKERAYLGLGRIEWRRGNAEAALGWMQKASESAVSPALLAEALLAKAQLESDLQLSSQARQSLERLLAGKFIDGRSKARGLLQFAELLQQEGEVLKATAYYQRVYVAYGKHLDLVSQAYVGRGMALEAIDQPEKALEVYREFAGRRELSEFKEAQMVQERLVALSGINEAGVGNK